MSIKELSFRKEKLTSGHRVCAGCGATIVVRQVLMATHKPVVVCCPTGCLEVSTTIYPSTAWEVPYIHSAFENAASTLSGVEAAYKVLMRRGKIDKKDIRFAVFAGDGGTYDIGLQALSGVLERGHRLVYVCYDNQAYMNCLSTSCLIMTENGLKKITEVKEGDKIHAFDQKTHQLVLRRCTGVFDNGIREVYEVETLHHSIKATANHPFLVLKRNGRGRRNTFVWKTLAEIKVGDEVVVLKNLHGGKPFKFNFRKTEKGDYKVNRVNEINIPEYSSPDLMKYLGIYVGDGGVRTEKKETGFALPKNSKARKTLVNLHSKIFGSKIRSDDAYVYIDSVNLARFIGCLGFGQGAKNKKIPGWVFTLPKEEKENFVRGLMLSDSYKIGGSFRYVSASRELLRTLRLLLQTTGFRVGKIHWQKKKKGTKCVHRKLPKDAEYGYVCFSTRKRWNIKKYPNQYRYQNFLIENKYFDTEKIKNIRLAGCEPTLDLRVEDEHNFIADGIVVHNTGIQRSSATPLGAWTTTSPVGEVIPGKTQNRKDLTSCVVGHNIPYVAQASPGHWRDLVTKAEKAFNAQGPAFLNILAPCPRGWRYPTNQTIRMARLAVETCFWSLYEVEDGRWRLTHKPREKRLIMEWLKPQGRFKHLFKPENRHIIEEFQAKVDEDWNNLLKRCQIE